jgi:hypothetical protein
MDKTNVHALIGFNIEPRRVPKASPTPEAALTKLLEQLGGEKAAQKAVDALAKVAPAFKAAYENVVAIGDAQVKAQAQTDLRKFRGDHRSPEEKRLDERATRQRALRGNGPRRQA